MFDPYRGQRLDEEAAESFADTSLHILMLPMLVLLHWHLGKEIVSIRNVLSAFGLPAFVFYLVALDDPVPWIALAVLFIASLIQRAHTRGRERVGDLQTTVSFGLPITRLLGVPQGWAYRLMIPVNFLIGWYFVYPFSMILGIWWLLGSGIYMFQVDTMLQAYRRKQLAMHDQYVMAKKLQEDLEMRKLQDYARRGGKQTDASKNSRGKRTAKPFKRSGRTRRRR